MSLLSFGVGRRWRPLWSLLRVLLALPAWLAAPTVDSPALHAVTLAAVAAGELIDRSEYCVELDPPTPGKQLAADLRSATTPLALSPNA